VEFLEAAASSFWPQRWGSFGSDGEFLETAVGEHLEAAARGSGNSGWEASGSSGGELLNNQTAQRLQNSDGSFNRWPE